MVRILSYIHARRTMAPLTGVGQHMLNMMLGLGNWPGVEQVLLASGPEIKMQPAVDPTWALRDFPVRTFPLSRGMMERLWWATHFPKADRWYPQADWVYAAADVYIPTRRARFAVTIHDIHYFEGELPWSNTAEHLKARKAWRLRLRPMIKHADAILTVSEFSKQRMVELLGIDPRRIAVIGNGIDPAEFNEQVGTDSEYAGEPPYLFVIGGLMLRKGAQATLELARKLAESKSAVRILIAGKSETRFAQQAKELPNIVQLGYVPAERLPQLLRGALALLFLSRYEGFGIPIVEAFACGTPAIISEYSSLPEIGGDAAIIARDPTHQATIEQIEQLIKNPAYRAELIARGRPIAEKYTWHNCVRRLVDVFEFGSVRA